jgi:hypothetical protein
LAPLPTLRRPAAGGCDKPLYHRGCDARYLGISPHGCFAEWGTVWGTITCETKVLSKISCLRGHSIPFRATNDSKSKKAEDLVSYARNENLKPDQRCRLKRISHRPWSLQDVLSAGYSLPLAAEDKTIEPSCE